MLSSHNPFKGERGFLLLPEPKLGPPSNHSHAIRSEWTHSPQRELLTFLVMMVTLGTVASANA